MTWNPVTGCTKVSPGCKHCYADGWRATFYPAGRAHSQTSAVGSAWAPEPWVAVQRAAWEG